MRRISQILVNLSCNELAVCRLSSGYERIYFNHIRKTAGRSIYHALLSHGGEPADIVIARVHKAWNQRPISGDKVYIRGNLELLSEEHFY